MTQKLIATIPTIGICLFVALYVYSAFQYPGGSQANAQSIGFDWIHNYWCNLMDYKAINGDLNPARPFAILASGMLCFSLMVFFLRFAFLLPENKWWKKIISAGGVLSMISASLIFTTYHDLMTIISSVFGGLVVVGVIKELFNSNLTIYKISGIVCLLLLGLNNYIYYSEQLIQILPLLQKITFTCILLWILGLNNTFEKWIKN
jgi:hypothetical protein